MCRPSCGMAIKLYLLQTAKRFAGLFKRIADIGLRMFLKNSFNRNNINYRKSQTLTLLSSLPEIMWCIEVNTTEVTELKDIFKKF